MFDQIDNNYKDGQDPLYFFLEGGYKSKNCLRGKTLTFHMWCQRCDFLEGSALVFHRGTPKNALQTHIFVRTWNIYQSDNGVLLLYVIP